jgi:hypothetical protein
MKDYEYIFVERWVLSAKPEAVYGALSDFNLYTRWGAPAYCAGTREGPVQVGCTGKLSVHGSLPYKVQMKVRISSLVPNREIAIDVSGDVIGEKVWMLRPFGEHGTELISDWRCDPDWMVFRALTPVVKPLFRWNHGQCINTAVAGLARYLHHERERKYPVAPRKRRRTEASVAPLR